MKLLVLDANILMRAVLGTRVAQLLSDYAMTTRFFTATEAFEDATTYVPAVLTKRGVGSEVIEAALHKLDIMRRVVQVIPTEVFAPFEHAARERLHGRDEDDWPYLALALVFDCPLWTEDRDFFGCGIPLWTTDRVEIYLQGPPREQRQNDVG